MIICSGGCIQLNLVIRNFSVLHKIFHFSYMCSSQSECVTRATILNFERPLNSSEGLKKMIKGVLIEFCTAKDHQMAWILA